MRKLDDIIGYGPGYDIIGSGPGYDIVGNVGAGAYPQGAVFYPANNLGAPCGWGPQGQPMALANAGPPAGADVVAGGWGGWGPGCFGPPVAPLAVQRNEEPLVGLAPRCPTRSQTQFVGLGSCEVEPCETVTLRCSPCVLMKIIRFVIPSSIAFQLEVVQITVNGKETLINCGPVSGALFVENATDVETISTETIQPGCCIEVELKNISNSTVCARVDGVARVMW